MRVGVKDRLPLTLARIELKLELAVSFRRGNFSNQLKKTVKARRIIKLKNVFTVNFWNHQNVYRSLRVKIQEGYGVLVFGDQLGWNLAIHYLAKNTVHVFLLHNFSH
jgi:hypothetical protein